MAKPKVNRAGMFTLLIPLGGITEFHSKEHGNNSVIGRKRKNGNNKLEKRIGLGAGKS